MQPLLLFTVPGLQRRDPGNHQSGKAGKTKITAGVYTGWSKPTRKGEFLNATQYRNCLQRQLKCRMGCCRGI